MKNNFIMLCKSYSGDKESLKYMIDSFHLFNRDMVHLYLSVPANELHLFGDFNCGSITVVADESYAANYFADKTNHGFSLGYFNQEICKLAFWECGFCENYLCVDSDIRFIRDFHIDDFMKDQETPYTVLVMDKDLCCEKYYQNYWTVRSEYVRKIFEMIGLQDRRFLTCHGMQNMNVKVLESMKKDFMEVGGLGYKDLIEIAPYEFTWYNAWLQKSGIIDIEAVEPFFKTFHLKIEYIFSRLRGIGIKDLQRSYTGICLNSNWKGSGSVSVYKEPGWIRRTLFRLMCRI